MLKLNKVNAYKKAGKAIFVYEVTGSVEETEKYIAIKEAEGISREQLIGDSGKPLYWATRPIANGSELRFSHDESYVYVPEDESLMVLESLLATEKDPLQAEMMAKEVVKFKMQQALSNIKAKTQAPATQPAEEQAHQTDDRAEL